MAAGGDMGASPAASNFHAIGRAWVCRGRPKCGLHKSVAPRSRDGASTGVERGGVEVGRVVCGHRLGSARLLERAERATAVVA